MRDYLALLRRRPDYRALWLAYAVSLFGDWFNTIATVTIVNRYTESGQAVGLLLLARALPPFLMGPVAGVVADRFDRKTVLILTNVTRALVVLGFLLVRSEETVWLVYVLSVAQFVISSFFEPTQASVLPTLVKREEIVTANTLINATWSAMLAIGAAAGGLFAAAFGTGTAIVIDSATFVLAAVLLLQITVDTRPTPEALAESRGGLQDFIDGVAYLRSQPRIAVIATVKAISQVGSIDIMAALYAERLFPIGEDGAGSFGLMLAAMGVGSVLGPVLGDRLGDGHARTLQRWIVGGFVLIVVGWLGFGLAPSLPAAMAALVLRGAGGSINWTYSSSLQQLKVPDKLLGRVFAIDFAVFTLVFAASVYLTGWAVDVFTLDPRTMALILAGLSVPPFLVWLGFTAYTERNPDPSPPVPAGADKR